VLESRKLPDAGEGGLPVHLPWLDGLRGIAALWVLLHHTFILTGGRGMPVLSWGKLAVDLFMMLSGFLMAHHYMLRRAAKPWGAPSTWTDFWARRWFRISPLYYALLAAALVFGPLIGDQRDLVAAIWPATATAATRYNDAS
jgi:peptidoglycan/LPS O-acetylase OafA/YrhL